MTPGSKTTHRARMLAVVFFASLLAGACEPTDPSTLEEIPADVRASIDTAVERGHRVGVVVGLVNPQGRHFHASGVLAAGGDTPMTPGTKVGIGSLTKLFTAELLADAVIAGRLTLDTPVASLLPVHDSADTRLWQLATHRAGLPRQLPAAALEADDVQRLYASLSAKRELPAEPAYSNVGYSLLGQAIAASAETSLPFLVESRIADPMQLTATSYAPDRAQIAMPHHGRTTITPSTIPKIAYGSGGLYSTAADLLTFVQWHLYPETPDQRARVGLLTGNGLPGGAGSLGWKRHREGDIEVFHHGGDGNGYQAFVGFRPANGTGVVLLTNSSADDALQQVALHLLVPDVPLPDFDHSPAMLLTAAQLAPYEGRYQIVDDGNFIELFATDDGLAYVERDGDGNTVRESRLFAVAPDTFELREIPVTIAFDGPGSATLTAGEQAFKMQRIAQAQSRRDQ